MIVGNGNDGATESRSVDVRLHYGPNTESSGTGRININVRRRTIGKHDARNIYIFVVLNYISRYRLSSEINTNCV